MFFEPGMEIDEDGAFKSQLLELDAMQQIVIQERDNRQAAGEKFYDDNQEYFGQISSDLQEMSDSYSELNLGNEVLSYETAVSLYYGRADEQTINSLSKEQRYAFECWSKLAEQHDMVTEYICHYGERGIFTREYAEKLSKQMDAIVKYDKNYWDQFMYQLSEITAGVISVGESALRFTIALGLGLTSAGAYLFGADEYAEDTLNIAEGWLSESWAQQMREGAQKKYKADAQDMRFGRYSFLFGQILPGVVIAASTGGAGAGTMLGAGTSSGYSAYAVFGAVSTAGTCAQTALQEGASFEQAMTYGALAGLLDLGATAAFGGLSKNLGIDTGKIAKKIAGNFCTTETGRYFAKQVISAAIEQPMDTLAFYMQPELKRLTYDPNAKSYTVDQIAEATIMGFAKHSLRNIAWSLPELASALNSGNATLPGYLKQQVDENFESSIAKAQAGETPDTGAAVSRPETAVAQMEANTAADMGNQRFETPDAGDRLASVLASDPELAGIDANVISDNMSNDLNNQQSFTSDGLDSSWLKQNNAFSPASNQEGVFNEASSTDKVAVTEDGSADTFGKIVDIEINNGSMNVQRDEQKQESNLAVENNDKLASTDGKPSKERLKNYQVSDLNFSLSPKEHMDEAERAVPVEILKEAIATGTHEPDPCGSSAIMYYTTIHKNGKKYNLEVLYNPDSNTVFHFKYTRKAIGPLPKIKK